MTKKILVIEDEEIIRELLFETLNGLEGYEVILAGDGENGLQVAAANNPDIVILDVQLPKLNGHEVCRSIKSNPAMSHTRILMISGMAQNSDQFKAMEMGADDYLTKPFDLTTLIMKVKTLLGMPSGDR